MGGWPSTTGNPSGGGRWNNEEDDGYDDYDDEGYTPVSTYSARSYSNYNNSYSQHRHNEEQRRECRASLDEEFAGKRSLVDRAVKDQEYIVRNLSRLLGNYYDGTVPYSEYGDLAQKYFGTESLEDFSNTIIDALAESQKKVREFKKENYDFMYKISDLLSFPRVSESKHILISSGLSKAPFGSHVVNGSVTNQGEYLWKTDLRDETESYGIVSKRYVGKLGVEELNKHSQLEEEFVKLYKDMKEKEVPVIQCYHIFRANNRSWQTSEHWMSTRGSSWCKLEHDLAHALYNEPRNDRFASLASLENPYQVIYDKIESDHLEALEELSTRKAAKKVVDDDYNLKWDEIRKCYPC